MPQYAYVYNLTAETVPIDSAIPLDSNGAMTGGISHTSPTDITLANAGTYLVTFSVSGTEPNQIALFRNGTAVLGSTYGSGAGTQQNNGQIILVAGAGDVLTLVNHSSASAIGLASAVGGTGANVNASIAIEKLG